MPVPRVKDFLDAHAVPYLTLHYSHASTCQDVASASGIPLQELAKVVVFLADERPLMAIIPDAMHVNMHRLRMLAGARTITLLHEWDLEPVFPDCEVGAMPPLGNLYGMPVYIDKNVPAEWISFMAGSHREIIRMHYPDFERLVQPQTADIAAETPVYAAAV